MPLKDTVRFLTRYLESPRTVGSVTPSSPWLARALAAPAAAHDAPINLLEIGAGTGPVTRHLGHILGPEDQLDVCEMDGAFIPILEQTIEDLPPLARAKEEGRVRILHCPAQDIDAPGRYDYVISAMPLTVLDPPDVLAVLSSVERNLRPGGVFSYFEYVGLRKLALRFWPSSRRRRSLRDASKLLDDHIRKFQIRRRTVLRNIPPAHARYWKFDRNRDGQNEGVPV